MTTLIVFAREPVLGKVKTRLQKDLPASTVLRLYKSFLGDVLRTAAGVTCSRRVIFYTGARSIPFLRRFKRDFSFSRQRGKDLGERMHRAFLQSQKRGSKKTVIIGTDVPDLQGKDIREALAKLETHDVVLGPCRDGGYYLIGLKKPDKRLFFGIPWSTDKVLQETLKRTQRLGKKICLLKQRNDIDTYADLKKSSYLGKYVAI